MRNWNPDDDDDDSGFLVGFLQYLWGIETEFVYYACSFWLYCFYSTYEELKRAYEEKVS